MLHSKEEEEEEEEEDGELTQNHTLHFCFGLVDVIDAGSDSSC